MLGEACLQPKEDPHSPLPSHVSFSLPLSGSRRGQRKETFHFSFPEATKDESWGLLSLKVVEGIIAATLDTNPSLYNQPLLCALGSAPEISFPLY